MIKIKYLCEYPNYLPKVAQLWRDTIGQKWRPEITITEIEARFRDHLNKDALPLTYIALDDDEVIGTCSFRSDDGFQSKYIPWLASLCVEESHRKRGIGKLLIKMIKEKAHKMGFTKLYLGTFEQEVADWYERNGWQEVERIIYQDHPTTIMMIEV